MQSAIANDNGTMLAFKNSDAIWHGRLDLGYVRRGDATILAKREHFGPLRIQKPFYPEGAAICHTLLLHPPSGIAGGDELSIAVGVENNAHALLTTPGAGKWYRSAGSWATQRIALDVGAGGALEWLPQENIVFNGARANMQTNVTLAADARFIGWEVLCFGRRASGEKFDSGELCMSTRIDCDGKPLWLERGMLNGGSPQLFSPAGLAGYSVSATLLARGKNLCPSLVAACRELAPMEQAALHGLTLLPDILAARYLGHSAEAARAWMIALWQLLRPEMLGREARMPRIWNT